jgi:uncharacterized repeat protein (TIGR02543 family)
MRKAFFLLPTVFIICFPCLTFANTSPQVSNVTASQRTDGSGIVDIGYTLNDADGNQCTVSIVVSNDGGGSWNVAATDLSGDIGAGISPGRRHIIWKSKTDLPGEYGTNYRVKVTADDGSYTYTLNVNSSGVSGVSISSSTGHGGTTNYTKTLSSGTSVTLTAPLTAGGQTFTGWTGDVNSSDPTISFSMDGNKTVTANYVPGPPGMVWVSISEAGFTGYMSKYETTNAQYCQYLNAAKASSAITVSGNYVVGSSGPYSGQNYYNLTGPGWTGNGATNGGAARINWTGSSFTVDSGFENHPVTYVSWYGSTAFASYYGWRLPTEWEWQAVADHTVDDPYTYGCGPTINNSIANYYGSTHTNGTTVVGAFGTYGYGMCDLAGNVWEWTSSCYYGDCDPDYRVLRSGCWDDLDFYCEVSLRYPSDGPGITYGDIGFRACR